MKSIGTIFIVAVVMGSIGLLWFIGQSAVSTDAVPSLTEFIASTTAEVVSEETSSSTPTNTLVSDIDNVDTSKSFYQDTLPTKIISLPAGNITVMVASNQTSRTQGLSGYPYLEADRGMLFIFPVASTYSFWMKDMNFPIDIVWMNSDRVVTGISANVSPESFPESFPSPGIAQFVLEIPAGTADIYGIEVGSRLML